MTPTVAGDLTLGKVDVMSVNGFAGDPSLAGTGHAGRTGAGVWVEIIVAEEWTACGLKSLMPREMC